MAGRWACRLATGACRRRGATGWRCAVPSLGLAWRIRTLEDDAGAGRAAGRRWPWSARWRRRRGRRSSPGAGGGARQDTLAVAFETCPRLPAQAFVGLNGRPPEFRARPGGGRLATGRPWHRRAGWRPRHPTSCCCGPSGRQRRCGSRTGSCRRRPRLTLPPVSGRAPRPVVGPRGAGAGGRVVHGARPLGTRRAPSRSARARSTTPRRPCRALAAEDEARPPASAPDRFRSGDASRRIAPSSRPRTRRPADRRRADGTASSRVDGGEVPRAFLGPPIPFGGSVVADTHRCATVRATAEPVAGVDYTGLACWCPGLGDLSWWATIRRCGCAAPRPMAAAPLDTPLARARQCRRTSGSRSAARQRPARDGTRAITDARRAVVAHLGRRALRAIAARRGCRRGRVCAAPVGPVLADDAVSLRCREERLVPAGHGPSDASVPSLDRR